MKARYLLGIALCAAAAVAACGNDDSGSLTDGTDRGNPGGSSGTTTPGGNTPGSTPGGTTTPAPGNLPTGSAEGKAFFVSDVFPFLSTKCGGCHAAGGAGNPSWVAAGDGAKTYDLVYLNAYATENSRIVVKGVHSGGTAPELTAPEKTTWATWLAKEASGGAKPVQQSVLEKFGECFDKAKFDAIGFNNLRTTRRQNGNNPKNLNENANNCTGCDNAPCRSCHTFDDVTGFVMAVGAGNVGPDYTFENTKKLNPPFIRQYVGTTPTGEPTFNPGIKTKSTNTVEQGAAYSHPMYKLTPAMEQAIQAFVDDAITKYKAKTCGQPTAAP